MRSLFIYGLAIVGAVYLLGSGSRAMRRSAPDLGVRVVLQDHSRRPIRSASVAGGGGGEDVVEYRFSLLGDNGSGSQFVRSKGWYGPIPRECPQPADSVGWYAAVPGVTDLGIVYAEPDWSQQPKRPRP